MEVDYHIDLALSHAEAMSWQEQARERIQASPTKIEVGIFQYRAAVVTGGRRAQMNHRMVENLSKAGIEIASVTRGGLWTLHGPGQIVVYPIIHVGKERPDFAKNLTRIYAQAMTETFMTLGLPVYYDASDPGVWISNKEDHLKVGQIGFAIREGITEHGFAMNIVNDVTAFGLFKACSGRGRTTSLVNETPFMKHLGTNEILLTSIGCLLSRLPDAFSQLH